MADAVYKLSRAIETIRHGIETNSHLGAQLYVSRDGRTIADIAICEAKTGVPMRTDHLMPWMSSTKPVTAVAISQMWERGLFSIADHVARQIPSLLMLVRVQARRSRRSRRRTAA